MSDDTLRSISIISMVLGLLAMFCFGPLTGLPALILAIIVLYHGERVEFYDRVYAFVGIVGSVVGFIFFGFLVAIIMKGSEFVQEQVSNVNAIVEKEYQYSEAAADVLSTYLIEKYPKSKFLVITYAGLEDNERDLLLVDSFEKNIPKEQMKVVSVYDDLSNIKDGVYDEKMLQKIVDKHQEYDIVISLVGLPYNPSKQKIWDNKKQKLVLLFWNCLGLKQAILDGRIIAVVATNPKMNFDNKPVPEDPKKAFDERYILITPDNIRELSKKYDYLLE